MKKDEKPGTLAVIKDYFYDKHTDKWTRQLYDKPTDY